MADKVMLLQLIALVIKQLQKHIMIHLVKHPIPQRSGGSIPIVALFEQELKSKTILMGFGLNSDAIHSPNEHFGVWNYLKGIETIPLFYKYFTELSK